MTADPFTQEFQLCDDDGIVRGGAMHHGTDYGCTGHAHYAGQHIRCTNLVHVTTYTPPQMLAGYVPAGALAVWPSSPTCAAPQTAPPVGAEVTSSST